VDLLQEAALVEQLEIAPNRHVRDAQVANEVGDPYRAVLANPIHDHRLPLPRQHGPHLERPAASSTAGDPIPNSVRAQGAKVNVFQHQATANPTDLDNPHHR
jgi:hypothetical protein